MRILILPSLPLSPRFQLKPGCTLKVIDNGPGQNFSISKLISSETLVTKPDKTLASLINTCGTTPSGSPRKICIAFTASGLKASHRYT